MPKRLRRKREEKAKKSFIFIPDSKKYAMILIRRRLNEKILIVEEELSIQALPHDFLKETGYDAAMTSDGRGRMGTFYRKTILDLHGAEIAITNIRGRVMAFVRMGMR